MIKIVQRRKIWFTFSLILISASIVALSVWGLKLGIDLIANPTAKIISNFIEINILTAARKRIRATKTSKAPNILTNIKIKSNLGFKAL